MEITDKDMTVYNFGERKVWPKPDLSAPYDLLDHHNQLQRGLERLPEILHISSGRMDHMVQSLDTLAYALQSSMYRTMVLREALTGFATQVAEEQARAKLAKAKE